MWWVLKPPYWLYHLLLRVGRWLVRRFTPPGLGVLTACVIAGLMGPDTENNVTYQGFAVLFFLLVVSVVTGWFFRARFSATRFLPRFGTVGVPMTYSVRVRNLSPRPQAGLTLLEDLAETPLPFHEWLDEQLAHERGMRSFRVSWQARSNLFRRAIVRPAAAPPMSAGGEVDVAVELRPARRGVLRFGGITMARPDVLGLFRGLRRLPAPQTTLILPRRYPLPPIALPGTLKYQEGGVALASNVGQSDEFVALRDYRHGDPLRHIHWRSWAHAGKPVVKEFEDEFFVRHALVLDTFLNRAGSERFEEAVSVAASFACTLVTQESLLDLLFVGTESYCFTAGRGLAHGDQMLEVLAAVQPCRTQSFRSLETLVLDHSGAVSGCICVLLEWNTERQEFVKRLKMLGVPLLVLVLVDAGAKATLDAGPMREDPEHFRVLEVGKIQAQLASLT